MVKVMVSIASSQRRRPEQGNETSAPRLVKSTMQVLWTDTANFGGVVAAPKFFWEGGQWSRAVGTFKKMAQ